MKDSTGGRAQLLDERTLVPICIKRGGCGFEGVGALQRWRIKNNSRVFEIGGDVEGVSISRLRPNPHRRILAHGDSIVLDPRNLNPRRTIRERNLCLQSQHSKRRVHLPNMRVVAPEHDSDAGLTIFSRRVEKPGFPCRLVHSRELGRYEWHERILADDDICSVRDVELLHNTHIAFLVVKEARRPGRGIGPGEEGDNKRKRSE